jgi:hypothetical protein
MSSELSEREEWVLNNGEAVAQDATDGEHDVVEIEQELLARR